MGRKSARLSVAVMLILVGTCWGPGGHPMVSGPLVQRLRPDSAAIVVHVGAAAELELFCLDGGTLLPAVRSPASRRHVFSLTGLRPQTRYVYRIRATAAPAAWLWEGEFRTPLQDGEGAVRFAAWGDSGATPWWVDIPDVLPLAPAPWLRPLLPGRGGQWALARRIEEAGPDLALVLGDVVYMHGQRAHYPEGFFRPFARLLARIPFYPTVGNHDTLTENAEPYLEAFALPQADGPSGGRYYDFVHGPVHFFSMDTFSSSVADGSPQRRWLAGALAASRSPWKVLFTHRPFWTASRSRPDPANRFLREHLHPLLARHSVRLVLSGHDHLYQRMRAQDGVNYVIAGGGGKSIYDLVEDPDLLVGARVDSFVLVEADARTLRLRALGADGVELDRLELTR